MAKAVGPITVHRDPSPSNPTVDLSSEIEFAA
jgi:hypothetical protein